ncbi:hypothetical protein DLJ47_23315 [Micromonospora sp. S4605]|uniref:hypothetical protein n=1 Tax=Micromonospora sp. S4605 TaxID=1420897 RepID=UPI000D6F850A|nr:hypothetical protein [Micromonospora sp. S4605]PWU50784.1 hypothetical protein DLJ47_23315 [Micromonospora sp. S4605]
MTNSERTNWWNTLSGLLTGIAAIITAIGALIGALHLIGVFDGQRPVEPPAAATGLPTPANAEAAGSVLADASAIPTTGLAPNTSALSGSMRQGLLTMADTKSADLESGVVGPALAGQDFLVVGGGSHFSLISSFMGAYMSPVESQPGKDVCTGALDRNRIAEIEIDIESVGKWWCVRTGEGHTGAIQVKSVSLDPPRQLVLAYVLWR